MIKPLFFYQHWRWEKSPKKCRMGMTQDPWTNGATICTVPIFSGHISWGLSPLIPVTIGFIYGYIWYLHFGINGFPLDISEALGNIKTKSGWWLGHPSEKYERQLG